MVGASSNDTEYHLTTLHNNEWLTLESPRTGPGSYVSITMCNRWCVCVGVGVVHVGVVLQSLLL